MLPQRMMKKKSLIIVIISLKENPENDFLDFKNKYGQLLERINKDERILK